MIQPILPKVDVFANGCSKSPESIGSVGDGVAHHEPEGERIDPGHQRSVEGMIDPPPPRQVPRAVDVIVAITDDRIEQPDDFRGLILVVRGHNDRDIVSVGQCIVNARSDSCPNSSVDIMLDHRGSCFLSLLSRPIC